MARMEGIITRLRRPGGCGLYDAASPVVHAEARGRGGIEIVHDPFQPLPHCAGAKVQEEPDSPVGEPEIC